MHVGHLLAATWRLATEHGARWTLLTFPLAALVDVPLAFTEDDAWVAAGSLAFLAITAVMACVILLDLRGLASSGRSVPPAKLLVGALALAPTAVLVGVVSAVGTLVGLVLLVVPGLLLAARWSVALPLVVVEDAGPIEAFRRSNALVRGATWRVVLVLLPPWLVAILITLLTTASGRPVVDGVITAAADAISTVLWTTATWVVYEAVADRGRQGVAPEPAAG